MLFSSPKMTPKLSKEELVTHLIAAGISAENASKYSDTIIDQGANEVDLFRDFSEVLMLKKTFGFLAGDIIRFKRKFQGIIILVYFYSILFYSILFYSILFYSIRLLFAFYSILFYSPIL